MKRKLFCELCPLTYNISIQKNVFLRKISDRITKTVFAEHRTEEKLQYVIYEHKSLIRRVLGDVDMTLQDNKAINLAIATPNVSGILIRPGETFSFWHLVGKPSIKKGYKEGLTISNSGISSGVGGGMCQFTNLIHWMVLHSPLEITEHHHHDGFDLFPDYGRQIPFGTGTSVFYNYVDYRVKNNTDKTFQLITYVTDTHLCGQLRCTEELDVKYHIESEDESFVRKEGEVFRKGKVFRKIIDKQTGNILDRYLIRENFAKVMYDTKDLVISEE